MVVWDPHAANDSRQPERVRNTILRFARFVLKIPCPTHDYATWLQKSSALLLWMHSAGIRFIKGILNSTMESSELLSLISFKVPQRSTRTTAPFYVPRVATNYRANEPLRRLMSNANEHL